MSAPPPPTLPRSSARPPRWRCVGAGAVAALGLFATDVGYGFLAYASLGNGLASAGIVAAFLASVLGSLIPALVGGAGASFGGPRPAQVLIFASFLASAATTLGGDDPARLIFLGSACVVLSGGMQMAFGALDLGRFVRFTPLPVLAGFTNGVALSMLVTAASIVLDAPGLSALASLDTASRVAAVVVLLGLMALAYRLWRGLHWSLFGLIAGTLLYHAMLTTQASFVPGTTLPGVASLQPPLLSVYAGLQADTLIAWLALLPLAFFPALSIAVLNSLESLVIANQQDLLAGTRHNSARVLVGQGLANIVCGVCGALPTAPSNSRRHLAEGYGGHSALTALSFAFVMLLILLATPHFVHWLPKLAVAAVLIYMALSIVDDWSKRQFIAWWRGDGNATFREQLRLNLAIMAAVSALALAFNLGVAMAAGVLLAMILFIRHNSRSIIARVYRGNKRHSSVMRPLVHTEYLRARAQVILLVELDGALFFGSGDLLLYEIERLATDARHLILDFRRVKTLDASGARTLPRLRRVLDARGIRLTLAGISPDETRGRLILASAPAHSFPTACWFADADLALEAAEDLLLAELASTTEAIEAPLDLNRWLGLDAAALATLRAAASHLRLASGEALFRRKDPGDTVYLLLTGKIEIQVPMRSGTQHKRLIAMRPGTFIGEMAVLRGAARSADAIATLPSELLALDRHALDALHADHPDIALALFRAIGVQLSARLASQTDELRYALAGNDNESD